LPLSISMLSTDKLGVSNFGAMTEQAAIHSEANSNSRLAVSIPAARMATWANDTGYRTR